MHFTNFVFEMLVDRINVNNLVKGDKITKEQTIVKSAESYFERHFFNQEFYYQGQDSWTIRDEQIIRYEARPFTFEFIESFIEVLFYYIILSTNHM